ncbi:MAG: hypothetical protein E7158_01340 [Firmicutes bacterium]|nr:hypothetical protein [Bacillota bacterium]
MKRKILIFLISIVLLLPINSYAISKDYVDKVSPITGTKIDNEKINLYLFHGQECPHCEQERKWLESIKEEYKDYLNINMFEVWHDKNNAKMMDAVATSLGKKSDGVPFTVIGDTVFIGFSDTISSRIETKIKEYSEIDSNKDQVTIPILGNVNMKNVSIWLVAIILGFIDGFNPCAMWILLFLINMLFGMKDKKKSWFLGITFLFISALVYFLSLLGINFVLSVATISYLKIAIAIFILVAGILNFRKYLKTRKEEAGCTVVDDKKRKKIITKMKNIMSSKSFILSLIGIITLAASVNLIELACSLGFPVIFNEILTINNVNGLVKIIYLLIYIFFYMVDDMVVFIISMITIEATGVTNKYNKLCTLISSIIMIIMGLLLIVKPEWLMLNF